MSMFADQQHCLHGWAFPTFLQHSVQCEGKKLDLERNLNFQNHTPPSLPQLVYTACEFHHLAKYLEGWGRGFMVSWEQPLDTVLLSGPGLIIPSSRSSRPFPLLSLPSTLKDHTAGKISWYSWPVPYEPAFRNEGPMSLGWRVRSFWETPSLVLSATMLCGFIQSYLPFGLDPAISFELPTKEGPLPKLLGTLGTAHL